MAATCISCTTRQPHVVPRSDMLTNHNHQPKVGIPSLQTRDTENAGSYSQISCATPTPPASENPPGAVDPPLIQGSVAPLFDYVSAWRSTEWRSSVLSDDVSASSRRKERVPARNRAITPLALWWVYKSSTPLSYPTNMFIPTLTSHLSFTYNPLSFPNCSPQTPCATSSECLPKPPPAPPNSVFKRTRCCTSLRSFKVDRALAIGLSAFFVYPVFFFSSTRR